MPDAGDPDERGGVRGGGLAPDGEVAAALDARAAELVVRPIGVVCSPFKELAEAPRQPRAAEGVRAHIELFEKRGYEDALSDLEGWEHVWVLTWLHRATGWRPMVLPPRSERKRGVFSTRAPRRPNPIGLSVVRLVSVVPHERRLEIADVDMIDGTPVLDLKPYVPWTDAIPASKTGWLAPPGGALPGGERPADPRPSWRVELTATAAEQLAWLRARGVDIERRLVDALSLGPQPHAYRRIKKQPDGTHRISVKDWYARFRVLAAAIRVEAIEPGIRLEERNRSPIQIEFTAAFPAA